MAAFKSHPDAICENLLSKIGNSGPDSLRLAANYLCLGGESSNIPKAICNSLNSLFDKKKSKDFKHMNFENFSKSFFENLIRVLADINVLTYRNVEISTLGEKFKIIYRMLGGPPEFLFPTPTHDSLAKYYVHLFVKILNEENATVFPECYSENGIAKHCKDYLVNDRITKVKSRVKLIKRLDDLDVHSSALLMDVKQILLLNPRQDYKIAFSLISQNTEHFTRVKNPVHTVIVNFLEGNRPVLAQTGSAEERFWKLVDNFRSQFDTFAETFNSQSLHLCVKFARDGFLTLTDKLLKKLNEKFVESKLPKEKASEYMKFVSDSYSHLLKKDDTDLKLNLQNLILHCGFVSREIKGPVDFGPINY